MHYNYLHILKVISIVRYLGTKNIKYNALRLHNITDRKLLNQYNKNI